MKKIKVVNMNKEVIDNLLHEVSYEDYVLEGVDLINNSLSLVLKKNRTDEENEELDKYTKRLAEVNFIMEMLSSLGDE